MLIKTSALQRIVKCRNPIFSCIRNKIAYSGDGRTTVRILNQDTEDDLMIKSYGVFGFRLNNNITVLGPIALFPRVQVIGASDAAVFKVEAYICRKADPEKWCNQIARQMVKHSPFQDIKQRVRGYRHLILRASQIFVALRSVLSWRVNSSADITKESLRLFALIEPRPDLIVIGLETRDRKHYDSVFRAARENNLNAEILPTENATSTFNFLNAEGRSVCAAMIPPSNITTTEDDVFQSKMHYDNLYQNPLPG